MKRRVLLISILLLISGCAKLVPTQMTFPAAPPSAMIPCEELGVVPDGTEKLSEVLLVVTDNYSKYHQCKIKVDTWNDWYLTQRKLYMSGSENGK